MTNLKKIIAVLLSATLITFTGCKGGKNEDTTKAETSVSTSASTSASSENVSDTGMKKVGIIQFTTHASLDNCTEGLLKALEGKAEIEVQVGSASSPETDCQAFASNMVSKNCDLIIAVATPAAIAAYSAVNNASADIPVVFCAVSDPVAAGIINSLEAPGTNCTGTKDAFDIEGQISIIKALQPELKKLGVIYTISEPNSISQVAQLKDVAKANGIEIVEQGINDATEVASAAVSIVSEVDAITNLTDNNVVNNIGVVLQQAETAGIPVYGSEIEQVKLGCLASASLDYVALGERTGEMALSILNGANAAETPVVTVVDSFKVLNEDVLATLGLTLPDELSDIEKVNTAQ